MKAKSLKRFLKSKKNWLTYFLLALFFLSINSCNNEEKSNSINNSNKNLIAMVMINNQYGYINTKGHYIIEPQYTLARTFSNGLACVNIGGSRENTIVGGAIGGKYVFINTKNEIQFDQFTSSSPMSFYNEVAIIQNDDNTFGIMNKNGEINANKFTTLGDCQDGLIPAVLNQKIGFLDLAGNWKIELPFKYFIGPFSEGLSCFSDVDKRLKGYFNSAGEIAIPAQYTSANNFKDGLARVQKENTYFFIKPDGQKAFPQEFIYTSDFSEGLCAVENNGQWGFINKQGELAIQYMDFEGVRDFSEGLVAVKKEGKVGYMNTKGEIVVPTQFDNGLPFKNGFAIIEMKGKMGFINTRGNIVIPTKFERIGNFVDPNTSNPIMKVN